MRHNSNFLIFSHCSLFPLLIIQILSLGLWLHTATFVASKAVTDQQAEESQASSVSIAQQRVGYDYTAPAAVLPIEDPNLAAPLIDVAAALDPHAHLHDHHDHHHHEHNPHDVHDEHDPGFWKKRVDWKEGWKKYWVS